MRPRIVWTILLKELVDTLRDRRTLFAMLVLPVLLYPLLFLAIGRMTASTQAERRALKPEIALWGQVPEEVPAALAAEIGATVVERRDSPPGDAEAEARRLVADGKVHAVLVAPADSRAKLSNDDTVSIDIYYDPVRPQSDAARERISKALDQLTARERDARTLRRGLPAGFHKPYSLVDHDLAGKQRRGGDIAGRALPFILILVMTLGSLLPAVDLTAGEKERGTLQTLLTAPVHPVEIVAGKYLTVVIISLCGTAANLASMGFALSRQLAAMGEGAVEFRLGFSTALAVFGAMVPAAFLVSALLLALAVFTRSFREANAFLTPIMMAVSFPSMVTMMPGVELGPATAFAPIVNLALLARDLLRGQVSATLYVVVVAANLVYATMAVLFAARVFETEQVLLGGERPWRDVFGDRARARLTPTPRNAVFFVTVLIVVTYYGVLWLISRKFPPLRALAIVQVAFLLLPSVLWVIASRCDLRATLRLALPKSRGIAGALLFGAGAWAAGQVVISLLARVYPGTREYAELLEQAMRSLDAGTGTIVLVVAVLPALAEEACFRGVVLSGLANTGSRVLAIGGSAAAFGLFHVDPHHMIHAAIFGALFAYVALESGSILPSLLAHLVNNGLAVISLRAPPVHKMMESPIFIAVGCVLAIIGVILLRNSRRNIAVAEPS